jgi:HPt (histidine-containing phosphotransfer) domain-containing protein
VLDQQSVLARVGGNVELLKELEGVFRDDCARLIPEIRQAVGAGDARQINQAAHTLKGMVAYFGAADATEAANSLERMGHAGELESAQERLSTLIAEIDRLQAALAGVCGGKSA